LKRWWRRLQRSERGATAVEYGLLIALLALFALGAINTLGSNTLMMWTYVSTNVTAVH